MTFNGCLQILIFFLIILAITNPLGVFMAHVFNREKTFLDPMLRPIERLIYRLTGVDETREMRWTEYAATMLLFSAVSMLVLYVIQRLQGHLPFNPQHLPGIDSSGSSTGAYVGSAFNTAASFTTNTNWQSYIPEVTMSYLTQMAGLAYHNFVSAAVGIALAIARLRSGGVNPSRPPATTSTGAAISASRSSAECWPAADSIATNSRASMRAMPSR